MAALEGQCVGESSTDGGGLKVELGCDSSSPGILLQAQGCPATSPRPHAAWNSLVYPAVTHKRVHLGRTLCRAFHPLTLLDELQDLGALHLLLRPGIKAYVKSQGPSLMLVHLPSPPLPNCPAYLVGLLAVGEGLPHGDPVAPDIAAAGELPEVDALWCIPLQRPLSCRTGLRRGGAARTGAQDPS